MSQGDNSFSRKVGSKEKRKLRAEREGLVGVWYGLGVFGIVGWSVALPTLAGIFLGVWIDLEYPGPRSWTLMLLVLGLIVGCMNAAFWVNRQRRQIVKEREEDEE